MVMAQRKELLKAHAFTTQRLVAALVDRDPDNPTPPLRRLGIATFISVLLSAVLVGVFALYGYFSKEGTPSWAVEKAVIIDTDSGVVFFTLDGKTLHPATNITSARLVTGNGGDPIKVTTASLATAPRGDRRGIATAPAQLPAISSMGVFPLRVCSLPTSDRTLRHTVVDLKAPAATSDVAIGLEVGNRTYIVVDGIAHLVPNRSLLGNATALRGTEALLRSLPQGQEIKPFTDPTKGNTPTRGKNDVGTIVYTGDQNDKGSWQYFIQLIDGYSAISYLDAMVNNTTPSAISRDAVAAARSEEHQTSATPKLPMGQVTFSSADITKTTVCATYNGDATDPKVTIGDAVTGPSGDDAPPPAVTTYDRVTTSPGGGALLRTSGTAADGATFLIWQGHKYGIPDMVSRTALGYGPDDKPTIGVVEPAVLSLIPDGMPPGITLDETHANRPA
jgi:type VII secretion protein EccB